MVTFTALSVAHVMVEADDYAEAEGLGWSRLVPVDFDVDFDCCVLDSVDEVEW